jgi:hypothetical protein
MSDIKRLINGDKLLKALEEDVELVNYIKSGRFDIPSNQGEATKPNYTEADIQTALTRELTDERVSTAAAYWLDASPHERWEPDGIILARYARHMLGEAARLREVLERTGQIIREVWSGVGNDMDINPSAKRIYLAKLDFAQNELKEDLSSHTEDTGIQKVQDAKCNHCRGTGIHTQDGFCYWCNGTGITPGINTEG